MSENAKQNEQLALEELQKNLEELTPEQIKSQAGAIVEELQNDLNQAFKRIAEEYKTEEKNVQYAIRFRDLPGGQGAPFYSVMVNWKQLREGNFNKDILGIMPTEKNPKAHLFPDTSGKEQIVNAYLLGFAPLKIEGIFIGLCKKYQVTQWSKFSGIFYKLNEETPIKLGIFIQEDKTIKKVETIDVFDNLKNLSLETFH